MMNSKAIAEKLIHDYKLDFCTVLQSEEFLELHSVAGVSTDELYITDYKNEKVFLQNKNSVTTFLSEESLNKPMGAFTDKAGRLYVCDTGNQRILIKDKELTEVSFSSIEGEFRYPAFGVSTTEGIVLNMYDEHFSGKRKLLEIKSGTEGFVFRWIITDTLDQIHDIKCYGEEILFAEFSRGGIRAVDIKTGQKRTVVDSDEKFGRFTVQSNYIWVVSAMELIKFNLEGKEIYRTSIVKDSGDFCQIRGIASAETEQGTVLWLADSLNNKVYVYKV